MRNRLHEFVATVLLYVYINFLHNTPSSHGGVLLFVPDRTDLERLLVSAIHRCIRFLRPSHLNISYKAQSSYKNVCSMFEVNLEGPQ